jgi:hypothetical protein
MRGPHRGLNEFENFQTDSIPNQIHSNTFLSKKDLSKVQKIEIKYGFEGFDERNNFLLRNFLKFEVDFE